MSRLAVYNSKGGVGKTTSAVNLAWTAALAGRPVLLWDLDPQGASSFLLRDTKGLAHTARKLATGDKAWSKEVRSTPIGNLWLIPGDASLRHWDLRLAEQEGGKKLLSDWLKPLSQDFDVIILDCPPGLTVLSESLFRAADALLVPVVPSALGMRTLESLRGFLERSERKAPELLPFLSMVDRRKADHRELSEHPPQGFLETFVPLWSDIERSLQPGTERPWWRSPRARDVYDRLWQEVARRAAL